MKVYFNLLLSKINAISLTVILKIYVFLTKNRLLGLFFIVVAAIFIFKDNESIFILFNNS